MNTSVSTNIKDLMLSWIIDNPNATIIRCKPENDVHLRDLCMMNLTSLGFKLIHIMPGMAEISRCSEQPLISFKQEYDELKKRYDLLLPEAEHFSGLKINGYMTIMDGREFLISSFNRAMRDESLLLPTIDLYDVIINQLNINYAY